MRYIATDIARLEDQTRALSLREFKSTGSLAVRFNVLSALRFLQSEFLGRVDSTSASLDDSTWLTTAISRLHASLLDKADLDAANRTGSTALHIAASAGQIRTLRLLLGAKADPNVLTRDGTSPLDLASHAECQQELKAAGADGWTSLMVAVERRSEDMVRNLLKDKLGLEDRVKACTRHGRNAMHVAADEGFAPIIRLLAEAGVSVNARDDVGQTPLDLAADDESRSLLESLGARASPPPRVGAAVRLSLSYRRHDDAAEGPLRPGQTGTLVRDDASDKPYLVRGADGSEWWYRRWAIVSVAGVGVLNSPMK
mmetsp:Transcript_27917/g.73642  ORF Transcript_27917/g.73642 Transcript_27917/m.73642 type:complete len:313 (+) Transcript_27917:2685-3623(+)